VKNKYFIKYMRNPEIIELGKKRPTALVLLLLIVNRAKNTESGNPDLNIGEAFIGDWKIYCKSQRCYRDDKQLLARWQILTYRATNKGTIARLSNRDYFDVDWENQTSKQTNNQTDNGRSKGEQQATNIEIRNKKTQGKNLNEPFLTQEELWKVAFDNKCSIEDVKRTYFSVLDEDNREKYKINKTYPTLKLWIMNGISKKTIPIFNDSAEIEILKFGRPLIENRNKIYKP